MDNELMMYGLIGSAVLNVVLFIRNRVWKMRTFHQGDVAMEINKRCHLAFSMLLGVAKERGLDEKEFNAKMVMLASVPEELREGMMEKVLPPANKSGNHIGFN